MNAAVQQQQRTMDALLASSDAASVRAAVTALWRHSSAPAPNEAATEAQLAFVSSPWFRTFIRYDPAPALRGLRMPVLALFGGKDVQVVATQNEPAMRAALADNRSARVTVFRGLNHLFQTAATGAVSEYAEIEETIAPEALQTISDWLAEMLRPRPTRLDHN
jgi:pimeloyl-ACP methyl ester carboxylesterase